MEKYIALKTDIIRSKKILHRDKAQEQFLSTAQAVNRRFDFISSFVVTHGDEAQGLLAAASAGMLYEIVEFLTESMAPYPLRFGYGYGDLNTRLQQMAIGMDGPAWQRANDAIGNARSSHIQVRMKGFNPGVERGIEVLANMLLWFHGRWTKEQCEAIALLRGGLSQTEAARRLKVSEVAVSKRLAAAGWRYYNEGKQALGILLPQAVLTIES
ncbi:MAG: SatD family protein [Bacillota bacterium]